MPELPEVETVRAGVAHHVLGACIESVTVHDARSVRRHTGGSVDFVRVLEGTFIVDVARRGKYLWLLLAESAQGDARALPGLVVHLGMSGQLLIKDSTFAPDKHLKITLDVLLPDGAAMQLRFVDQRIFGGMFLDELEPTTDVEGTLIPAASRSEQQLPVIPRAVAHIARDPLDSHFSYAEVRSRMLRTSSGVKRLLLDQSVISGVGNIYADEALWRAKLHYNKPSKTLTAAQTRELLDAVTEVMQAALVAGGTSFDALYVNVNGQSGYFDRSLNAYGQAGKPCSRCLESGRTSIIVREPFMNRSSYRCPHCQRTPRQPR
ncbi:bifunctional DNA-formamidopyrimidine glycosylase/DNA-(apurinic or apyrimidinic site) lyase [Rothia sp. ZJ932]|uniref:bifunctional DNA-formamidopyrimidine glycosylase/DNA-(apurinic or apyrimidinic site) lyase n=1 Tax=Rothia sp. ZJ932 TaxID=2810516 RepID=UPI0019675FA8|nr:bifunctional DNA-formamidopyrimidine glycosylase/DNA-(apurinic or apyrimidinic site) lyase [Rothia sp. ZJ932]QRZ62338.1 bifunctional DNA-formamidopyrimidine glycosylase/DNA-(apurinic or apyrimidinic site) lyase [Rothia sp. ZJ932]